MTPPGLTASEALVLWTQLAALLVAARLLGALARRVGQPDIVGALLAGLLLGPSVFGTIWPAGFAWFLPHGQPQATLLYAISQFCLLALLVVLGAETDLRLIRALGRPALGVTTGSLLVPTAAGIALAAALPAATLGSADHRPSFIVLVTGVLAVSSLPVVARIISELGLTRRNIGQLAVAAATVNDAYGFVLLAVAVALAGHGGALTAAVALGGLLLLTLAAAFVGQRLVDNLLRRVRRHGPNVAGSLTVCLCAALAIAAASQALHVDAALGAFVAGVMLGRSRFQQSRAMDQLSSFGTALFAPLYFATAGLQVNLRLLDSETVVVAFVLVFGVGIAAKAVGVLGGAFATKLPGRDAAALAVALNGRGAMQVIIAAAGLTLGVLNGTGYTVLILAAILTSLAVPPALRATVRGWRGTRAEQSRLNREQELASNLLVRGQRLLIPVARGLDSGPALTLAHGAWPEGSELTLLLVGRQATGPATPDGLAPEREVRTLTAESENLVDAVLAEGNLGYGVVLVGLGPPAEDAPALPAEALELAGRCPLPVVLVRRGRAARRTGEVLVPVTGSAASRAAQEVGDALSRHSLMRVTLLHVLTRPDEWSAPARQPAASLAPAGAATTAAAAVLGEAESAARAREARADTRLRRGRMAGEEIAAAADELRAELVVLGGTVRPVGDHVFLGHTVEHVLDAVSDPTVAVVVLPASSPERVSEVAEG